MQKLFRQIILVGLFGFTCIGCASHEPQIFGMSQAKWITLNPEQQEQIVDTYKATHGDDA